MAVYCNIILQLDEDQANVSHFKLLPEQLFVALELCLEDEHENVKLAAAIALYTLERPVQKVNTTEYRILVCV